MDSSAEGFPWHGQTNAQSVPVEKASASLQGHPQSATQAQDLSTQISNHSRLTQKHNGKSRKRATSWKPSDPFIPQTRQEIDEYLAYGSSLHYNVRTIPPWVRDAVEDDIVDDQDGEIIDSPHAALVAQHNSTPAAHQMRTSRKGQTNTQGQYIMSSGATRADRTSRWVTFARASAYPRENFHGEKVDAAWLNENFTDYSRPWLAGHSDDDLENDSSRYRAFRRKRQVWYKRAQFVILRNPFVPLAFRFTVLVFAAVAIGLGASIFYEAGYIEYCRQQNPDTRNADCIATVGTGNILYYRDPSGLMAVCVDVVAIIYTIYITYDEYFSKPLGLRPTRAKVRLVLLDLFFIVFQSANLSLAFESLTNEQGACSEGSRPSTSYRFDNICDRAEALSAVLLVSLVAWLMTFSVSVLRQVSLFP